MNKYKMLSRAITIATIGHSDQFDKSGKPYILHPLKLMYELMYDVELATIAVLHDVVEDTDISIDYINNEHFSDRIVNALELLTHKPDQSYDDYILGICTNYDAIRVKRKDLEHNSQITRLKGLREKDFRRIEKYHKAFLILGEARKKFKG